ncbi:CU044_2847 family protein [Spirillospora sp. CA-294931]|uniref:CU044_2847 family protein n=1 Tax=Spirillospora sp. CA-294931 TaxID=3240042 RepID=UPI003D8FE44E
MTELVRWETDRGPVIVEVDGNEPGFRAVSRPGEVVQDAKTRFEDALVNVRAAAETALSTLRDSSLNPDTVELEFGVKLNAAAGAVIAKTSVEGHLKVKLTWGPVMVVQDEE